MSGRQSPVTDPYTKVELLRDLAAVRAWSEAFWRGFEPAEFFVPLGAAWSPADNVRHLIKSNRPVERALRLPKIVLLLRFGPARERSRGYLQVVGTYREALDGGLRAGKFAARPLSEDERTPAVQERSISDLAATLDGLAAACGRWSDRALDRLRLPHPGLGLLTVREMLLFTLYHNTHHVLGAAQRREPPAD